MNAPITEQTASHIARRVNGIVASRMSIDNLDSACLMIAMGALYELWEIGIEYAKLSSGHAHIQLGASGGAMDYGIAYKPRVVDGRVLYEGKIAPLAGNHFHFVVLIDNWIFDVTPLSIAYSLRAKGETFSVEPPEYFLYERPAFPEYRFEAPWHCYVEVMTMSPNVAEIAKQFRESANISTH